MCSVIPCTLCREHQNPVEEHVDQWTWEGGHSHCILTGFHTTRLKCQLHAGSTPHAGPGREPGLPDDPGDGVVRWTAVVCACCWPVPRHRAGHFVCSLWVVASPGCEALTIPETRKQRLPNFSFLKGFFLSAGAHFLKIFPWPHNNSQCTHIFLEQTRLQILGDPAPGHPEKCPWRNPQESRVGPKQNFGFPSKQAALDPVNPPPNIS